MSRQIRRRLFSPLVHRRVEQSGVANRSHRPQPLVKKSSGSVIIVILAATHAVLVGAWQPQGPWTAGGIAVRACPCLPDDVSYGLPDGVADKADDVIVAEPVRPLR